MDANVGNLNFRVIMFKSHAALGPCDFVPIGMYFQHNVLKMLTPTHLTPPFELVCQRDGCVWQRCRVFATTARNLKIMPEMLPTTNAPGGDGDGGVVLFTAIPLCSLKIIWLAVLPSLLN